MPKIPSQPDPDSQPVTYTRFKLFERYDNKRRRLKLDVNALGDFEQETGMGFAQMMTQRALFGSARAFLWAGLKHEDRTLTIEQVGDYLSQYLRDRRVPQEERNIDFILGKAIEAAVEQEALGFMQRVKPDGVVDLDREEHDPGPDPNVLEGQVEKSTPALSSGPTGSDDPDVSPSES